MDGGIAQAPSRYERSSNELDIDGSAAGAAIEDKLYLILYTGARIHCYPKYRDHVEQLLASIKMI